MVGSLSLPLSPLPYSVLVSLLLQNHSGAVWYCPTKLSFAPDLRIHFRRKFALVVAAWAEHLIGSSCRCRGGGRRWNNRVVALMAVRAPPNFEGA